MIGPRPLALGLCGVVLAGSLARPALAEAPRDDDGSRRLLEQAIERFGNGAFAEARALLSRARKRARKPALRGRILLHLGLNHAAEGQPERARAAFREALTHDAKLTLDPSQYKPALVELLAAARRDLEGTLEIVVDADRPGGRVPVVEVRLGGKRIGAPPIKRRLMAGVHGVEVLSPAGTVLHRSRVKVVAGQVSRLQVALGGPAKAPSRLVAPGPAGPSRAASSARRPIFSWVTGGAALLAAGVAVGVGVAARADADAACDLLAGPGPCEGRTSLGDPTDLERYRGLHDRAHDKATAANISWIVAGVLTAATVVIYLLERRRSARSALLRAAPGGLQAAFTY